MEIKPAAYLSAARVLIWASLKVAFHSEYGGLCLRGDWVM